MNKKKHQKYSPEYLFWKKRIEGQIRHTMYEHPEFFTQQAYEDNLVGRMAKRIIGEIVAAICGGNNLCKSGIGSAFTQEKEGMECRAVSSEAESGIQAALHLQLTDA